ncbi:DUF1684 domain-containing protein [Wenyingzhuangia sp. 2_MG-2023]|uniref:DUF1684 domain-containing protein n=1 Tax=Wenyingzhuangia sp. 2_MG-2023 TaxID=3062639 RepID=UPI0026E16EB5|nr:DUF1684 domain-containing protein [Wenyingzhuangia sp. 2_MG-2023]MDO6736274.1 DUF1684 domain-containing protein [Wenyingzhuangia sp. 2_MG-2023]
MKKLILIVQLICCAGFSQNNYQSEIRVHREELNDYFKNPKKSPLPSKKIKSFSGLPFFSMNEKYKVNAKLSYTFNSPIIYIPNTHGETEAYQQYALATFTIDGKQLTLSIYQNLSLKKKRGYENYLFIPFTDNSNGKNTYSGGRYIDTTIPENPTGYITLDFNKAYNPYCAYNKKYVCPIPPKNNHLDIEILAGVMY